MLAIIGGTGLYELPGLEVRSSEDHSTPFGDPSGELVRGSLHGHELLFLARHGKSHRLLPHEINYRANIFALKRAGATMVLGFSAMGSLDIRFAPGELAMPSQYIDFTRGRREPTFFGQGVAAHVSTAHPVSQVMISAVKAAASGINQTLHTDLTYACVEGPRLGTQAESHFMRAANCHLVGMTNVPEVFLAREAQMSYATIGMITDYDCWLEDPTQHVVASALYELYNNTLGKAKSLLDALLQQPLPEPETGTRQALTHALLSDKTALTSEQAAWLEVLQR
jgi:5'-methylthioadenosine phosphorylase